METMRMSEGEYVTLTALATQMALGRDAVKYYARRRGIPMVQIARIGPGQQIQLAFAPGDALTLIREHESRKYEDSPKGLPGKPYADMTGQKVNRLTFLSYQGNNDVGNAMWLCRCECGAEKVLKAITVRYGDIKSCGCLRRENFLATSQTPEHAERTRQIGRRNKGRQTFSSSRLAWRCATCGCDFGTALSKDRKWRAKGRFCSTECWYNHIRAHPELGPSWRGGSHPYYGPIWDKQARAARKRHGNVCQHCGKHQEKPLLHVHHVEPLREFDSWEKANDLINLISLCRSCHRKAESQVDRRRKIRIQALSTG